MHVPKEIECEKGGLCSFSLKKGIWKCRKCRCKKQVNYNLDENILKSIKGHTEAPWIVDPIGSRSSIISVSGKHIAMTNYFKDTKGVVSIVGNEHKANALLIASAPALLEEVISLRKEVTQLRGKKKVAGRKKKCK